ncbi:cholesterol catabolism transcriptional regulator KstR [Williamsia sp. MIQD14]|uniref:cholesterol catabolism transcriptional regulator KstR n=1 Tax=Williamsia sp. MIQD14 TaxID=3425703 RepID=UPI003DA053D4
MATPATPGGFAPTTDSPPAQSPQGESAADSRRPTAPQQSGADTDLGSSAQRERRRRILDSTLALASKGGYDAVQMRAVADRADVAVGTLYRYFPSKVHLLVTALARELERVEGRADRSKLQGDTALERLRHVLDLITLAMQRDPLLTEAMTRAFMFADASAAAEVDAVAAVIDRLLANAMVTGTPTDEDLKIARVISDVWMSNLVQWLTRRATATDVTNRLELTIELLLAGRESRS